MDDQATEATAPVGPKKTPTISANKIPYLKFSNALVERPLQSKQSGEGGERLSSSSWEASGGLFRQHYGRKKVRAATKMGKYEGRRTS
jgi:hypothetical protein